MRGERARIQARDPSRIFNAYATNTAFTSSRLATRPAVSPAHFLDSPQIDLSYPEIRLPICLQFRSEGVQRLVPSYSDTLQLERSR
jgi:hypothetical protein